MERADAEDVEAVESVAAAELVLGSPGLCEMLRPLGLELTRHSDDVAVLDHSLPHLKYPGPRGPNPNAKEASEGGLSSAKSRNNPCVGRQFRSEGAPRPASRDRGVAGSTDKSICIRVDSSNSSTKQ